MFNKAREKYIQSLLDTIAKDKTKITALEQRVADLVETNFELRGQITQMREQAEVSRDKFDALAQQMRDNVTESNALKIRYENAVREVERLKVDYKKKMDVLFDTIPDGGD